LGLFHTENIENECITKNLIYEQLTVDNVKPTDKLRVMSAISSSNILTCVPNEELFISALQRNLSITLGNKTIKRGKLMLYKKQHYNIQLTLVNSKLNRENFEIPIPFSVEFHSDENLIFLDYRITTLTGNDTQMETFLRNHRVKGIEPSQYFDKILTIKIE